MEMFLGEDLASGKDEENKIWIVDPDGEHEPQEILESKFQKWADAGWERG